jgi:predicted nucleic acid-binding protein
VIVVDSSSLIAFHNERDAHHNRAVEGMRDFLGGRWGKGLLLDRVPYCPVVIEKVAAAHRRL